MKHWLKWMIYQVKCRELRECFTLMSKCVDRIFDGETVHERIDFNEEELEAFLNSLSPQQFAEVQKFLIRCLNCNIKSSLLILRLKRKIQ